MSDAVARLYGHEVRTRALPRPPARSERLERMLVRADVSPGEWAMGSALAVAVVPLGAVAAVSLGPRAGAVVAAGLAVLPILMLWLWRDRAERRFAADLPAALETVARDLRSGRSLIAALMRLAEQDGSAAHRFARAKRHLVLGRSVEGVVDDVVARSARYDVRIAGTLITMAGLGGRRPADGLELGAAALRQQAGLAGEVRALVAQSKSSLRVLSGLPLGFVVISELIGGQGAGLLFETPTGRVCLVLGAGLNLVGLVWMRALVRSVEP